MSKRHYKPPTVAFDIPNGTISLPVDQPIAAYYRQSTFAQVGNISTAMQTIDLPVYLQRLGWPEDKIILIDMDQGVSGSTKIDERDGMRYLFELIVEGKVGAVACQDEDRLFRDVTQIQVNTFIEACKASRILVLTPMMVYDFANELMGSFHARQFRFKSEMAAEYITSVIRGKLHRAKNRLLMEGRWAGGGMPVGFMIDARKTLTDGSKNENWRRYVPFAPYAEVVNEYFRLFLSFGGSLRTTVKHIHQHGPWYPNPNTCKPPEGFRVIFRHMRCYKGGYCPGRQGLLNLLTNAAYIGHWTFNDAVIRWNNHPAIVPVDMFMRVFNHLSPIGLDGRTNPDFRPFVEHARPSCEEERNVEKPLCSGLMVSFVDGEWRNVGTNWVNPQRHYAYVLRGSNISKEYVWSKTAGFVDDAVIGLLRRKLKATFDAQVWEATLRSFTQNIGTERKRIQNQLALVEEVMQNQIASLDVLTTPEIVTAVQARYQAAKSEHARLANELLRVNDEAQQLEAAYKLQESCGPALENWDDLTRDEKRAVLYSLINKIEVSPVEEHGLHLKIHWRDDSKDEVILPRQSTTGTQWLPSEVMQLLELVDAGASQIQVAAAFPKRRWNMIRNKVWSIRGRGALFLVSKPIKDRESYEDYLARTGESFGHISSETRPERARPGAPA